MLWAKKCIGYHRWVHFDVKKIIFGYDTKSNMADGAILDFGKVLIKHKQNLVIIVLLAKCVHWNWAILADMPIGHCDVFKMAASD